MNFISHVLLITLRKCELKEVRKWIDYSIHVLENTANEYNQQRHGCTCVHDDISYT
jgi:hypothetical protein